MANIYDVKDARRENILIVDDDPDTCELLEMLLRVRGYRTASALGGREALQSVGRQPPDAVILDVMMPEMDGWETFERLRCISDVPVMFLTALTSGESAARAFQLGADDYLRKPYEPPELLARLENLLERRSAQINGGGPGQDGAGRKRQPASQPARRAITAVIPAFNEERFIGSVVLKVRKQAETVIVVDDGSTDATAQVAAEAGAVVLSHPANRGKGAALNTAFRMVREHSPSVVVMLDGDGQHRPEELASVVAPVLEGEADIVVGSRYLAKDYKVPRHRVWGHRAFNLITRLSSGVAATDSQSGYRAFSPRAVEEISFHSNGFSVESEMQFLARERGLRFIEVPVTIRYTDPPKRSVFGQGLVVINGVMQLTGQYRPLLFFGVPGLFGLLGGLWMGLLVVNIFRHTHTLAAGYAMISVLLTIVGMLGLTTGIILHSVRGLLVDHFPSKQKVS